MSTPAPESKPAADKSEGDLLKQAAPAVAEPAVQTAPEFKEGQKVKHANGAEYIVRFQNAEGVALEGVANLVHPSALKPTK